MEKRKEVDTPFDIEYYINDSSSRAIESNELDKMFSSDTTPKTSSKATMQQSQIANEPTKRQSTKQTRLNFELYKQTFLTAPKLENKKPVFISLSQRDDLDSIVRKLGERGMSVSGFVENLVRHHLSAYKEDIEQWRKL